MSIISKIRRHLRERDEIDLVRKIIYKSGLSSLLPGRLRTLFYFKTSVTVGKYVRLLGLPYMVNVGKNNIFYDNCICETSGESAKLTIGDNCLFSFGVLISYTLKVEIGNDVQVGEYTSIRDTTHSHILSDIPMKYSSDTSAAVSIGNDVWIGRGCLIQPGTIIQDGVVLGANSVAKGVLEKNGIYAGSPARLIKYRERYNNKLS